MRRDPGVGLSVTDLANPYRMAAIQGRVVEVRPRAGLPLRGSDLVQVSERALPQQRPNRVCLVIAVEKSAHQTHSVAHNPA